MASLSRSATSGALPTPWRCSCSSRNCGSGSGRTAGRKFWAASRWIPAPGGFTTFCCRPCAAHTLVRRAETARGCRKRRVSLIRPTIRRICRVPSRHTCLWTPAGRPMAKKKSAKKILRGVLRLIRFFRPQIVREKKLLLLALVAVLFSLVFQVLEPWPLKYIYDSIFRAGSHGRLARLPLAGALSPTAVILAAGISLVALVGLGAIADHFSTDFLAAASLRVPA